MTNSFTETKTFATAMRILVTLGAVAVAEWWIRVTIEINQDGQEAFFIDFIAFWTAARLALAGEAMTVWDEAAFKIAQTVQYADTARMPWFYPATWHMVITPIGALPFSIGWGGLVVVSLALHIAALRRVTRACWPLAVSCPAVLLSTMLGNNAILFAACLALALHLQLSNPRAAAGPGLLIAVLTMKPSLGITIPIALAMGGFWRTMAWTAGAAIALAIPATLIFGLEHWEAFFGGLSSAMARVTETSNEASIMISWYSICHYLGWDGIALPVHIAGVVVMAVLLALVWRRGEAAGLWRAATLMIAVSLSSPHAFYYELVYTMAGLAFAMAAGMGVVGWSILALLWIAPLPIFIPFETVHVVLLACPGATMGFLYCVWRGLRG